MPVNINAFNEYDATGAASFQNFQPGQAYTLAMVDDETVVLGKAADLAGAVIIACAQVAGTITGQGATLIVNSGGTAIHKIDGGAGFIVDNDGTLGVVDTDIAFGVTSAGNLSVANGDGTVSLLLVRLA
jgi:hypothetical protein